MIPRDPGQRATTGLRGRKLGPRNAQGRRLCGRSGVRGQTDPGHDTSLGSCSLELDVLGIMGKRKFFVQWCNVLFLVISDLLRQEIIKSPPLLLAGAGPRGGNNREHTSRPIVFFDFQLYSVGRLPTRL